MKRLLTVGQANTPHHADKHQLLRPDLRPGAFYESVDDAGMHVCGVNEMWSGILDPLEGYTAAMPFPNNLRPRKLGNGFVWVDEIPAKKPPGKVTQRINTGSGPRDIHLPLMRFLPPSQLRRVPILNVHAPREKDDPAGNAATHRAAIAKARQVVRHSGRCIVLGDPNQKIVALYRAAGAQVYQFRSGFIAAFGDVRLRNCRAVTRGVLSVWSDHPLLVAEVFG